MFLNRHTRSSIQLQSYIETIPKNNLEIVRSMLLFLAGNHAEQLVIETNLTADEKAVIKTGRKEQRE